MGTTNHPDNLDVFRTESALAARYLGRSDSIPYFRNIAAEGHVLMQNVIAGTFNWGTGEYQFGTGAASGTTGYLISGSTGGNYATTMQTAADFYLSSRFRCVTTPAAGTVIAIGGVEATFANFLQVGVVQATSAGFFSAVGSGGLSVISTTAIDTAAHIFRFWRIGANSYFQIDNGAVSVSASTVSAAAMCPAIKAANGTAADQRGGFQWFFFATPPV